MNLNDNIRGGTICLSKAGLGIAGTASKLKITAPNGNGVDFAIEGILYHKADTDNLTVTAAAAQAALTKCLYLVCLNSSGTLSTIKGTEQLTADLTAGTEVLHWPEPGSGVCPIGAVLIETASGYTFTAGTTEFSASGITDTYYDLMTLKSGPLVLTS